MSQPHRPNFIVEQLARNGYVYPAVPAGDELFHVDAAVRMASYLSETFADDYQGAFEGARFDLYAKQHRPPQPGRGEDLEAYLCRLHDWWASWPIPPRYEVVVQARESLVCARCRQLGLHFSLGDREAVVQASDTRKALLVMGYQGEIGVHDFLADHNQVFQWLTRGAWKRAGYHLQTEGVLDLLILHAAEYVKHYGCAAWRLMVETSRANHAAKYAKRLQDMNEVDADVAV